jgi:hypothetical protein
MKVILPPFVLLLLLLLLLFGEFVKMCPISGKTTKIPLNMRLMETARPSRVKVKRPVLHTCLQQPPQAGSVSPSDAPKATRHPTPFKSFGLLMAFLLSSLSVVWVF